METTVLIRVKLTTLDKVTQHEVDKILLDTTQVSNLIPPYEIIERRIEGLNE